MGHAAMVGGGAQPHAAQRPPVAGPPLPPLRAARTH
eukprot:CAMPEP_0194728000 /NCGR_PEP_ID=MMETSP0296-20130528/36471_1 /TAXON_ID=39354 /ORGANISM="Heterosigma akashiwo, Strain CCMP2393" /LENGTH=35 /DNA_ID= /DNA_START= /DNA_END= /DNA_ORIENTATION=